MSVKNLFFVALAAVAVLCVAAVPAAHAGAVICPVDVDTYIVPMGGCGPGYPINTLVKSMDGWLPIPALVKFDLGNLAGYSGSDVISASFNFYRLDSDGGMMNPATAPAGTALTATIQPLGETVILTEDILPGEDPGNPGAHGVINGCNRPGAWGPMYAVSNDTGPDTWASADITGLVMAWLDGAILNNGFEFMDDDDPDGYVWYWNSIQAAGNHPYLDVQVTGGGVIPEPATMFLFGTGLVGMMGYVSRRRLQKEM